MPIHSFYNHEPKTNHKKHPHILDVIMVVSNTRRFESRYRLFKKAVNEMICTPHVRLTVVEMAFGNRPHIITDENNVREILLRNNDELWHKEQMINAGIQRLPHDWKYVAWIDGDVSFVDNKNWALECIETLQHFAVIQPWSQCIDLGPNGESFKLHHSFMSQFQRNSNMKPKSSHYYEFPHPGYAWAARREAIDALGGMIDTAILGAGDHHMAWSLLGYGQETFPKGVTQGYKDPILAWQDRAMKYIKLNVGNMPGTIFHYFHGKKKDRQYVSRWDVLTTWQFNPETDLTYDWQGLWTLRVESKRQMMLRNAIRDYMASRNEDSIDLDEADL